MISKAIEDFDWDKAFLDKSADEKLSFLLPKSPYSARTHENTNQK